jgi:hypothetical protein
MVEPMPLQGVAGAAALLINPVALGHLDKAMLALLDRAVLRVGAVELVVREAGLQEEQVRLLAFLEVQ